MQECRWCLWNSRQGAGHIESEIWEEGEGNELGMDMACVN